MYIMAFLDSKRLFPHRFFGTQFFFPFHLLGPTNLALQIKILSPLPDEFRFRVLSGLFRDEGPS